MTDTTIQIDRFTYHLTDTGILTNLTTGHLLKGWVESTGYRAFTLGDRRRKLLHRLLAIAFISNPLNLPEVNHIDGDKLNNTLLNLEWVTGVDNIRHAFTTGLTQHNAIIDYALIPSLMQEVFQGVPLGDLACRFNMPDSSSLRKLLRREAVRTGTLSEFTKGTKAGKETQVQRSSSKINQLTKERVIINTFPSMNAAGRTVGCSAATIYKAIKNNRYYQDSYWEKQC